MCLLINAFPTIQQFAYILCFFPQSHSRRDEAPSHLYWLETFWCSIYFYLLLWRAMCPNMALHRVILVKAMRMLHPCNSRNLERCIMSGTLIHRSRQCFPCTSVSVTRGYVRSVNRPIGPQPASNPLICHWALVLLGPFSNLPLGVARALLFL